MAQCRSCGASIVWAVTEKGKRIPMDAEPLAFRPGEFLLTASDPPEATTMNLKVYRSHFATCPNANEHRKER